MVLTQRALVVSAPGVVVVDKWAPVGSTSWLVVVAKPAVVVSTPSVVVVVK
jgi:hypothetical protein